jgi:signal transduction histidine kinase
VADLPGAAEHALLRIAGEALFNTAMHGNATRAEIHLAYTASAVTLSIADDGDGEPDKLRLMLRLTEAGDVDGHHRGLANMRARTREHGGTFEVQQSRLGGVRVVARIPRRAERPVT